MLEGLCDVIYGASRFYRAFSKQLTAISICYFELSRTNLEPISKQLLAYFG